MCTYVTATIDVTGCATGRGGWFAVTQAVVYYDHPQEAPLDHALCLDLSDGVDPATRVAVELDAESARRLARTILALLETDEVRAVLS
jgi:hypothetical protein